MKFFHLSDLHIGKRVNAFSMLEDQAYILKQILQFAAEEKPDGIFIAGDVYDKPIPSAEAVQLFDDFLVALSKLSPDIFLISGNHDSPERLAFGARLMAFNGIHISPVYHGSVEPISLKDADGVTDVYLLPFLKPAHVRRFFPDKEIISYTEAMQTVIESMHLNDEHRNILLTHQFVTGALRSDSEEVSVGGSDNVESFVFDRFDYVALGHIHRPQTVGSERVRYSGTPLKYSFSEVGHEKSVTVVETEGTHDVLIRTIPLIPKRDLRELRGTYMELTAKDSYDGTNTDDYLHITLTDEEDVPDAMAKLRTIYPNLMKLTYDNTRTRTQVQIDGAEAVDERSPLELFAEFYEKQNNMTMSEEQLLICESLIDRIWEGQI